MKKAISIALAIFGMSVIAGAQSRITDQNLVHDGKDAIVTFKIETDDNSIPSKRKEVVRLNLVVGFNNLIIHPYIACINCQLYSMTAGFFHMLGQILVNP